MSTDTTHDWGTATDSEQMANPGADSDDANNPTKNPEKKAEIQEPRAPSFRS